VRALAAGSGATTTLAGGASAGWADGAGTAALFSAPQGIAVHPLSGVIFVADTNSNRIRSLSPDGLVATLAGFSIGSADAVGFAAAFNAPLGVALDAAGTALLIADSNNQKVRRLDLATLAVTSLAGSGAAGWANGAGAAALFNDPQGVALEPSTGLLWVTDGTNRRIRIVDPATGAVSTAEAGTRSTSSPRASGASHATPRPVAGKSRTQRAGCTKAPGRPASHEKSAPAAASCAAAMPAQGAEMGAMDPKQGGPGGAAAQRSAVFVTVRGRGGGAGLTSVLLWEGNRRQL
jgi:hypothetical protein